MPAVGSGSLFRVKDFQSRGGEEFLNVYFYWGANGPGSMSAESLAVVFQATFGMHIANIQPTNITHTVIDVEEVTTIDNFYVAPSVMPPGALVGSFLANFVAASIRLIRSTKETRGGWKRYVAGVEEDITGNAWSAAFMANLDILAANLPNTLSIAGGVVYPVIVRQTRNPVTGELLPPDQWIYNIVASAEGKSLVTTQNSRKIR